jgi:hypothetical protein
MFASKQSTTIKKDPFFSYTQLLIQATGPSSNNTLFVDSLSTANTIVTNGKPVQGSFNPYRKNYGKLNSPAVVTGQVYDSNWATLLNTAAGQGNYISPTSVLNSTTTTTSDFTLEVWAMRTSISAFNMINSLSVLGQGIRMDSSGNIGVPGMTVGAAALCNVNWAVGRWSHLAWVRSSGTAYFYVNGVAVASTPNDTGSYTFTGGNSRLGNYNNNANQEWTGYFRDFRIVMGTAVYPRGTTFTPPTEPLKPIPGTILLAFQGSRVIDNSNENTTLSISGTLSHHPIFPSAPALPYSGRTDGGNSYSGGSAHFNGSTDYLTSTINPVTISTGDFTLECWVYPTAAYGTLSRIFTFGPALSGYLNFYINSSGQVVYGPAGSALLTTTGTVPLYAWSHIAISRTSGVTSVSINGVRSATGADTTDYPVATGYFLGQDGLGNFFNGYISDFRLITGVGLYNTSKFSPPYEPLSPVTNANNIILLNFSNAGLVDQTGTHNITTYGAAAASTTQTKFKKSIFFDGSTSYLATPASATTNKAFNFLSGNYTLEAWVYFNSVSGTPHIFNLGDSSTNRITVYVKNSTLVFSTTVTTSGDRITSGTVLTTGQWYHVALTKNGTIFTLYLNGVSQGTSTTTTYPTPSATGYQLAIGWQQFSGLSADYFSGYMDQIRITPSIARYSSNASILVVGGGGGGGAGIGGGGGSGGVVANNMLLSASNTYTIVVGAGGTGDTWVSNSVVPTAGSNGSNSTITAAGITTVTAVGGGKGGYYTSTAGLTSGSAGGSGGGGAGGGTGQGTTGGTAQQPSAATWGGFGNAGGNNLAADGLGAAGGGGGAGTAGSAAGSLTGGRGGNGYATNINGTQTYYAGGGGGNGGTSADAISGLGGYGGGGDAGIFNANGNSGSVNTGGGGGGASTGAGQTGGAGGSGIVIISYTGNARFSGGTISTVGSNTVHTFTTSGSLTPLSSNTEYINPSQLFASR